MNQKNPKTAFATFFIGYLIAYYLILWLGATIFSSTVANSFAVLGEYETRLKIAILGSPLLTVLFGSIAAGVSASSYTAMGSHRLTPTRFFEIGWVCFCFANAIIFSLGLQLLVDQTIGRNWLELIGQVGFNAWCFLLAPTLGLISGIGLTILVNLLIEAQNS